MALDSSAKESNLRDSLKKFFVDNIETAEGISVMFDRGLNAPNIQGKVAEKWISINMGPVILATMSDILIDIYLCTRKDNEGYKLSQLRDKVLAILVDDSMDDGKKRITFYKSYAAQAWEEIGKLLVWDIIPSGDMVASDETKFKILTVILKVAIKI
jgi:hypothetical protein